MKKQKTKNSVQELMKLPSVGETKAKLLQDKGFGSFEKLVQTNPLTLYNECNIVLSSATHIISASVDHIDKDCPNCGYSDFNSAWGEYSKSVMNEDSNICCDRCNWDGNIKDLN